MFGSVRGSVRVPFIIVSAIVNLDAFLVSAIRARVANQLWSQRYFKNFGICDWYNVTVEYILEQVC